MKIRANKHESITSLVKALADSECYRRLGLRTSEVIEIIRGELAVLEAQSEAIRPNDDMMLEALVRIAALACLHAADNDLAKFPGVFV
jgi:hypothetical protein